MSLLYKSDTLDETFNIDELSKSITLLSIIDGQSSDFACVSVIQENDRKEIYCLSRRLSNRSDENILKNSYYMWKPCSNCSVPSSICSNDYINLCGSYF